MGDENALNYDPEAFLDDWSCTYPVGCTDENAENYDPEAVTDDGSCTFPGCADITWEDGWFSFEVGWGIAEIDSCANFTSVHDDAHCCVDGSEEFYTITCTDD